MAIKVNGTTVINDSRSLTNIASVDSATVTALGNAGVGGLAMDLVKQASNVTSYSLSAGGFYVFVNTVFYGTDCYLRITNAHSIVKYAGRDDYTPIINDSSGTNYYADYSYNHGLYAVYSTSGGTFNDWTSNNSGGSQGTNTWDVYKYS